MQAQTITAPNHLILGRHCFIVRARSLPNRFNQRPGMTLLVAEDQPLELDVEGLPAASAHTWLFAPEVRRRFVSVQPHRSITVEPAHPAYGRLLHWARSDALGLKQFELTTEHRTALDSVSDQQGFDTWIERLLDQHLQPHIKPNPRLEYLLALVDANVENGATAEQIWQQFRLRYPSSQAHCSHWLQECIGIPLRKLILWHKLRRAMESLSDARPATELAHAAGFADSAHLSRICLRTFGLNPSQANDHKILQVSRLCDRQY